MRDDAIRIGICLTIFAVFVAATWLWKEYSCAEQAKLMGVEYRWGIATGCMIKHDGRFVPLKNFREFQ